MKAKLIGKHPFMLRRGSFRAVIRPGIPAAGGGPSHYPEYGMIAVFLPIFREHGLPFTEPEVYGVFPVEEKGRQGGKGAGASVVDFLWITNKKNGPTRAWRRPVVRLERNLVGGSIDCRYRLGIRAVAVAIPVHLVQELHPPARCYEDLGGEAIGVFLVLLPSAGLELARHVDQAALLRVLLEHIHQAGLKGDDPVPLRLVDAVTGLSVHVALVGGDG